MGLISIAAFRPKHGMHTELVGLIDERIPLLRGLGLITDRAPITCRSADGVIVSISEWVSDEAIAEAHAIPEVLELWGRFADCCDWITLDSVPECSEDFATFEAIN